VDWINDKIYYLYNDPTLHLGIYDIASGEITDITSAIENLSLPPFLSGGDLLVDPIGQKLYMAHVSQLFDSFTFGGEIDRCFCYLCYLNYSTSFSCTVTLLQVFTLSISLLSNSSR
jgi:hypothetical protein